jgi:hypothetical protein
MAKQSLENVSGSIQLRQFACGQGAEMRREILDTAPAALLKQASSFSGGADVHAAGVLGISTDFNEAAALESGDDPTHRRRLDLLGGGQLAERSGTGKDQDGKGGELCGAYAGGRILLAHAAQQVDRGGMKANSSRDGFGPRRDIFGLDFCHRI